MGSYAYCQKPGCGAGIPYPGIREAVSGTAECYAGHENDLQWPQDALICVLEDMQDTVEALQKRVGELETKASGHCLD